MEAAELFAFYRVTMERRVAQETSKTVPRDFVITFMVDIPLVVLEKFVLLFGENVRLQRDFKLVLRFDVRLQIRIFALVYGGDQVESIFLTLFLPV